MRSKNLLPNNVRIETTSLHSFNNALHALYHRNQYDLVAKVEQSKLNIPADLLASWKASIDMEVEINKQSAMSALTKELETKDAERDKVLSQLFNLIRAHRMSFVEADSKAGERLYAVLKPYFGIQKEAVGDETLHIVGMLKDTERLTAEVTTLGLAPVLTKLKTLNEEFEKLDAQRRSDAVAEKLPDSRSVRRQTDNDFDMICQCIHVAYLLSKNDKELIRKLIDEMNRVSADKKAAHNASMAQKKPKDKKKPGGGDDGKTPGKPDEKPGNGGGKTPGGDKGSDGKGPNGGKTPDDGKGGKGKDNGKGKGGKKGGDDGNVSPEKALITPLLPALETELNLAHDCLAYGGVTDVQDGVTIYLIVNKRTQEEMYVKVEGGKLVVVEKKG